MLHASPSPDLTAVVAEIRSSNSPEAISALYTTLAGFKKRLLAQLGTADGEDAFHEGFIAVLEALQQNKIQQDDRFLGFCNTVFHFQYCRTLKRRVTHRNRTVPVAENIRVDEQSASPLNAAIQKDQVRLMRERLLLLPKRWKELMVRFYVNGETKERICQEMGLSDTQFRLIKSRAKATLCARLSNCKSARPLVV